jgi:hypothetical protein
MCHRGIEEVFENGEDLAQWFGEMGLKGEAREGRDEIGGGEGWFSSAIHVSRSVFMPGSGEWTYFDQIKDRSESDMVKEIKGVTGQEGTMFPNVSTFVTAQECVLQIFIVGAHVVRPW